MPSNHLILCHPCFLPLSIFPSIRVFSNESVLHIRWPKYWSFSFNISFPVNIQYSFPLGWTGWISLQSKGLSGVFSNTTVQKHQFFGAQLSLQSQFSHPYMTTGKTIALTRWTFVGKVMSLLFNMLSSLVITFLPRSKCLFNFMAAITLCSDFGAQKVKSAILSTVSPSICFILFFIYSRRWVIEDLALIYVIKCSAYVFL